MEVHLDKVMLTLFGSNAERERFSVLHTYDPEARHGQLDWEDADHVSSPISSVVRIPALPINMALPTSRCLICAHLSAFSIVIERYEVEVHLADGARQVTYLLGK